MVLTHVRLVGASGNILFIVTHTWVAHYAFANGTKTTVGDSVQYDYDFGDNWQHEIVLEQVLPAPNVRPSPICLGGERHRPPEDVGGTSGYERFLEVIFDPTHEEYEQYVAWAGGSFQPEEFNVDAVNEVLKRMRWPLRHGRRHPG